MPRSAFIACGGCGGKRGSGQRQAAALRMAKRLAVTPFNITWGIMRTRPGQPLVPQKPHRAGRMRIIHVMSCALALWCGVWPPSLAASASVQSLSQQH